MFLPDSKIEKAVAKNDVRYYLQYVHYEPEKKRLVATNGHIAAVVEVAVGADDVEAMIPVEVFKRARDLAKGAKSLPAQVEVNGCYKFVDQGQLPRETDAGKFPDIDAVIPKKPDTEPTFCLDVKALAQLAEAICRTDKKGKNIVRIWVNEKDGPAFVEGNAGIGVIMPCRW